MEKEEQATIFYERRIITTEGKNNEASFVQNSIANPQSSKVVAKFSTVVFDSKAVFDSIDDFVSLLQVTAAAQDLSTTVFHLSTASLHLVSTAPSQLRPVTTKTSPTV
ncbi:hypothetical protein ACH5RR_018922 [Cinchona calisaya]|uniref:Uncharacterized protein n=1 Tax=Cinchona calisaya TaxID=153742 RepID=A0ABD2ZT09_9GENT